ncbi:hypothetical protein Pcinc_041080 [Petrolisthes cinctipes]|uniref:Uncharacterized protein n=1 Tax=Petrolisthes cinctipes TaxID=88211 RepID=A0AAE1EHB2_PETCI|nr:hypothetical protein Pcinc_041080 [Petrolisthes cinctipes]
MAATLGGGGKTAAVMGGGLQNTQAGAVVSPTGNQQGNQHPGIALSQHGFGASLPIGGQVGAGGGAVGGAAGVGMAGGAGGVGMAGGAGGVGAVGGAAGVGAVGGAAGVGMGGFGGMGAAGGLAALFPGMTPARNYGPKVYGTGVNNFFATAPEPRLINQAVTLVNTLLPTHLVRLDQNGEVFITDRFGMEVDPAEATGFEFEFGV